MNIGHILNLVLYSCKDIKQMDELSNNHEGIR